MLLRLVRPSNLTDPIGGRIGLDGVGYTTVFVAALAHLRCTVQIAQSEMTARWGRLLREKMTYPLGRLPPIIRSLLDHRIYYFPCRPILLLEIFTQKKLCSRPILDTELV